MVGAGKNCYLPRRLHHSAFRGHRVCTNQIQMGICPSQVVEYENSDRLFHSDSSGRDPAVPQRLIDAGCGTLVLLPPPNPAGRVKQFPCPLLPKARNEENHFSFCKKNQGEDTLAMTPADSSEVIQTRSRL